MESKLGITDEKALADAEERISKKRAKELFDSGRLAKMPVGTYEGLREIHIALFGDIYDFAGEKRTVNIFKGDMRFAPAETLDSATKFIDIMPHSGFDEIMDKFVQMNSVHPFRKGNGRAMRIWLDVMFAEAFGKLVDWRKVDREAYNYAMEHCSLDKRDIVNIISGAITDKVGRSMFLSGIDASFALEGMCSYKTEDL